jgi:hypothetical protein
MSLPSEEFFDDASVPNKRFQYRGGKFYTAKELRKYGLGPDQVRQVVQSDSPSSSYESMSVEGSNESMTSQGMAPPQVQAVPRPVFDTLDIVAIEAIRARYGASPDQCLVLAKMAGLVSMEPA